MTSDSGSGAPTGFKGEVVAIGPIIGGTISLGDEQVLFVNGRYYVESGAENRMEGEALYLSASLAF